MIAMTGDRRLAASRIAALAIAALPATGLGVGVQIWAAVVEHKSVGLEVLNALPVVAFALAGLIIVAARPANRVGWWMVFGGVCSALGGAGVSLAHHGLVAHPGSVPAAGACAIVGQAVRGLGWSAMTLAVPVYFPDGQVLGPRWRWLNPAVAAVLIAGVLDPVFDAKADLSDIGTWHNPLAPSGAWRVVELPIFVAHFPLAVVVVLAAVVQLVQRWRTGDELRRQQLLLFACAATLTICTPFIAIWVGGGDWIFAVTSLPLPIAIGFAILARGLYDLRTAANRTLVWLTLSIAVAGVLALVIGIGGLLGRSASTPWLSWIAAGVAAACFAPLRDGLQRGVNRLTFGKWTEPYELLAELGQQLEASSDIDRLLADVAAELGELGLRDVRIAAADDISAGEPAGRTALPLFAYGAQVGTLSYRDSDPPLRPRDRRLLDDLAGHLGGVLHARQLMHDLQGARERLVLGREEERRRLRRDLHDGLGPALAGHLLRLDVIARRLPPGSDTGRLVDTLRDELRDTVQDVRRLVEGLRPPALDELGLGGALRQAANRLTSGSGVLAEVRCPDAANLPAGIEVAAYRIGTEAMTNVVKHARARRCRIEVDIEPGELVVQVRDDGVGLTNRSTGPGHGLRTMRERAEELRGSFEIRSADAGTTVIAKLPMVAGLAVPPAARPTVEARS
jgi:signal transduction histidine kinase